MTKRELRRLAYAATRDRTLLPVLHDALLETYPTLYGRFVGTADRAAERDRGAKIVLFNPRAMSAAEHAENELGFGLFTLLGPRTPYEVGWKNLLNDFVALSPSYRRGVSVVYVAGRQRQRRL